MKSSRWLSVGFCALFQCTGTETGNPVHDGDVQVALAPLSATVPRQGLGDVTFDSVAIRVASVSLEPCGGGAPKVLLEGRSVELFGGEVRDAQVPAGTYCAMIVRMGGNADSFAASRSVAFDETSLTFESQLRADVRLELIEPLATNGTQTSWVLAVDLAEWLDPIGAWLDSDATELSLDAPATTALRQAQARSLRLYEDVDGDGLLDAADIEAALSDAGTLLP